MIFEINNMRAFPSIFALMIEPFKTIWETDEDIHKVNAIQLFSYVELLCSPKRANPFYAYGEKERPAKVKKEIYGDENYRDTNFMILGIIKYKELLTSSSISYPLLEDAMLARDELRRFLRSFNLDDKTAGGAMLMKPRDVTNALKDIEAVSTKLENHRAKVDQELIEASKTRNQREIGLYER